MTDIEVIDNEDDEVALGGALPVDPSQALDGARVDKRDRAGPVMSRRSW
jgi:hypothetical protein